MGVVSACGCDECDCRNEREMAAATTPQAVTPCCLRLCLARGSWPGEGVSLTAVRRREDTTFGFYGFVD